MASDSLVGTIVKGLSRRKRLINYDKVEDEGDEHVVRWIGNVKIIGLNTLISWRWSKKGKMF